MMQKQEAGTGSSSVHDHAPSPSSSAYALPHQVDDSNMMTSSRSSLYDDLSFSGSSSASVGFPSPM
jgi:hypothetical protein